MAEEFSTQGMLDTYLFECEQLLEQLQEIVLEQKDGEGFDEQSIHEIFRAMHTIKGSSGFMLFDEITKISHKLEDVFFYIRESKPKQVPHMELVELVLKVVDFIRGELNKIENGESADGTANEHIAQLDVFLDKIRGSDEETQEVIRKNVHIEPQHFYIAPKVTNASRFYKLYLTYKRGIPLVNVHAYKAVYALKEIAEELIHYPEDIISDDSTAEEILENGFKVLIRTQYSEREICRIIKAGYDIKKVEVYESTLSEFQQGFDLHMSVNQNKLIFYDEKMEKKTDSFMMLPYEVTDKKILVLDKRTFAPGDFVIESKEPGKGKKLAKDKAQRHDKASFISVDVQKMDMLMDLMGKLVVSQSAVLQNQDLNVPGLCLDNFHKAAGQMTKISTDLQNVIMSMRMVSLSNTFQKMNRLVFDISRKLGKEIEFEMEGEETEVDKNILEHISDPLMHLVRNAVDHGIEFPSQRKAAGKMEKGKVTLSAKIESGKVWISVQDNGKGLDPQKILEKARKQGLLDCKKEDAEYTDKEVYQIITLPGFSTKEQVTVYSGRGVGMDVVVSNLQAIGGSLEIESTLGQGSRMILKIPLTLAMKGLKDGLTEY